jgi:hypothetical protein
MRHNRRFRDACVTAESAPSIRTENLAMRISLAIVVAVGLQACWFTSGTRGLAAPAHDNEFLERSASWLWMESKSNLLYSLSQPTAPYDVVIVRPHDRQTALRIKVMKGDQELYAWWGHAGTVFSICEDRLYYVDFDRISPGAVLVAVDLPAKKELWRSTLRGVGQPAHSYYSNAVNLLASNSILCVYGNETAGRYVEYTNAQTGETLANKVFEQPVAGGNKGHRRGQEETNKPDK